MSIRIKRVYEPPSPDDGRRVLVDRLWPRGLTKEKARIDLWAKNVAPSAALRRRFGHDPARWEEFRSRYRSELQMAGDELSHLRELSQAGPVTLLYGARDELHNQAVVLREVLTGEAAGGQGGSK